MIEDNQIFRECRVEAVEKEMSDDKGGLRIKVRIEPDDNDCETVEDLPYCYPLIPKHFHINPKVGEMVLVILGTLGATRGRRWYIGPMISQQYFLDKDPYKYSARSLLDNGKYVQPLPKPEMNPENEGTYPDQDDIALQGRQNADLILKNNEVRLRCGFKKEPTGLPKNTLLFNKEDLCYIQMKYINQKGYRGGIIGKDGRSFCSVINLVADRINLLSHDTKMPFKLNDKKDLITNETQQSIDNNAHPLVFGDELIVFLKKMMELIRTHTHPFAMDPPEFTTPQTSVLNEDLNKMLSDSIKIN